jgi:hypothetical protein
MQINEAKNISLGSYYAFHRASAILSYDKDREFGKAIAEYKDKNWLLWRSAGVFNIPDNLLKEFEI